MFIDNALRLASAQAFTASGGTTNYWDHSKAQNLGAGEPLAMVFTVTKAADHTTGDETYTFGLQCDDNTSFSSPTTLESRAVAAASLTVGKQVTLVIPFDVSVEEYVQGSMTLAGTTPSISVDCDIMPLSMVPKTAIYPTGYSIE